MLCGIVFEDMVHSMQISQISHSKVPVWIHSLRFRLTCRLPDMADAILRPVQSESGLCRRSLAEVLCTFSVRCDLASMVTECQALKRRQHRSTPSAVTLVALVALVVVVAVVVAVVVVVVAVVFVVVVVVVVVVDSSSSSNRTLRSGCSAQTATSLHCLAQLCKICQDC